MFSKFFFLTFSSFRTIEKSISYPTYYLMLQFFFSDRFFSINQGSELSAIRPVLGGVPQESVLGPLLYIIYTHNTFTIFQKLIAINGNNKTIN